MKSKYTIFTFTIALLCGLFALPNAIAAEANVSAILVYGSSDGDSIDPAAKPYARALTRFLGSSLSVKASKSTRIASPGKTTINLGQGHQLQIEAQDTSSSKVRMLVRWTNGKKLMQEVAINQKRGTPSFLAAGKMAVVITVR